MFVTPRQNRLVLFSSGDENIVNFKPVTKGYMSYLMLHFTCDKRRDIADQDATADNEFLPFGYFHQPMDTLDQYDKDFANINYWNKFMLRLTYTGFSLE